jgi:hypothetical protein
MRRSGFAVALALTAFVAVARVSTQSVQKLEYDTFCKLPDLETKRSAFLAASAENRTTLVRTHVERWRDANRSRLNDKQLAALAELIAAFGPDTYSDGPKGEEARAKIRPLGEAHLQLFTKEEMFAMQPWSPCIAKK